MLVLSRRPGEQVVLPHWRVVITVVSVQGKTVRLGITAPADIAVDREEVYPGRAAAGSQPGPPTAAGG